MGGQIEKRGWTQVENTIEERAGDAAEIVGIAIVTARNDWKIEKDHDSVATIEQMENNIKEFEN